ncbi:hypothetical protein GCM10027451_36300 [Geodermatophilus aquaeductus]|uniref:DNA-binding transcriptional regulator of glucitol operon n=1 Tax=Geodermatophilus aquaeductus TaxID=1564161 RepID=A0A521FJT9_9ACTN|nr:metalloprotease [Geodermatophilus aquaeductus]SMO96294.1 DNA-binding transcriptional regulator of glucitol operon [Geodermatophilus aquaeductus]
MSAGAEETAGPTAVPVVLWSRLLRPGLLVGHVVVLALFLLCLRFAGWQWERAELSGWNVQHVSYALQWPTFGVMGLFFYWRMLRIEIERHPDEDEPSSSLVLYQRPRIDTSGDPELAAYNAYLAELNETVLQQRG